MPPGWQPLSPRPRGDSGSDPEVERAERRAKLAALVGKRVLVGITLLNPAREVVEQRQLSGLIATADEQAIIIERDEGEGPFELPPDPHAFHPASPGHYRLRATGRVVVDPDLLSTWDFLQPANQ